VPELSRRLLEQLSRLSLQGFFGAETAKSAVAYQALDDPITVCAKFVVDYYGSQVPSEKEVAWARDYFCQILLVVYREAKKRDPSLAHDFASSFFKDFRGQSGSALLTRWNALAEAVHAFRWALPESNQLLVWQQASRLFLAYNEFLNGLLGLMIVAWRCGLGVTYRLGVIANSYGSKIQEFNQLTKGDNGPFYLFFRITNSGLRNAIAHGAAWLDVQEAKVRYRHGQHVKADEEMGLLEFLALVKLGTHMAEGYIAALSAIAVVEEGPPESIRQLPGKLRSVLAA
jgi:hypothetical protein